MPQKIVINADNVEDVLSGWGAGARIEVERSAVGGGTGFANVGNVAVVAGTEQYEFWDAGGASGDYYRTRYTTSAGATPSAYSVEFRGGQLASYASLDSLREYLGLPNHDRDNLLTDLLIRATGWLDTKCRRTFFRDPQVSGTVTRLLTPTRRSSLAVDIVSLSLVELAPITGGTYASLVTADWILQPPNPTPGWPYEELNLSGVGSYTDWRSGYASLYVDWPSDVPRTANYSTLRLTGVFGWPSIPSLIETATLELARESYRQGPGGGGPVGVNQFGTPMFLKGVPASAMDAVSTYRRSWGAV